MKYTFKSLKNRFKDSALKEKIVTVFIAVLFLCIAVFLIEFVVWTIKDRHAFALPLFHQDKIDAFMDFFNVNYFVSGGRNPYTDPDCLSNYPPFALLIAKFFALFGDYSSIEGLSARGVAMSVRSSAGGIISLVLFFLVLFIGNFFALRGLLKKLRFSRRERLLISVVFALSAPVLFLFQRANYLGFSLLFVLIFLDLYDSESKWLREVSYISLAMAFGVKLYPVVFGYLLLRDRRWLAVLRLVLYCLLFFFVPFLFFNGGVSNVGAFLHNVFAFSSTDAAYMYHNYAPYQIVYTVAGLFSSGTLGSTAILICKIFSYAIAACCVACMLVCEKRWQSMLAAALLTVYVVSPSYLYVGVMLLIPVAYFLAEEEKNNADYVTLVLFIVLLQPLYLGYMIDLAGTITYDVTVSVFLQALAMLGLFIVCVCGGVSSAKKRMKGKRRGAEHGEGESKDGAEHQSA